MPNASIAIRLTIVLMVFVSAGVSTVRAASAERALLDRYCITCHNERQKIAGLVLDTLDVDRVSARADIWEKVLRKVRIEAMPPPGLPRPEKAAYQSLATYLETELDRAAAASPNPGRTATLRRLTRTEYQNAVRDLLAVDALPNEINYSLLLPPDNS